MAQKMEWAALQEYHPSTPLESPLDVSGAGGGHPIKAPLRPSIEENEATPPTLDSRVAEPVNAAPLSVQQRGKSIKVDVARDTRALAPLPNRFSRENSASQATTPDPANVENVPSPSLIDTPQTSGIPKRFATGLSPSYIHHKAPTFDLSSSMQAEQEAKNPRVLLPRASTSEQQNRTRQPRQIHAPPERPIRTIELVSANKPVVAPLEEDNATERLPNNSRKDPHTVLSCADQTALTSANTPPRPKSKNPALPTILSRLGIAPSRSPTPGRSTKRNS